MSSYVCPKCGLDLDTITPIDGTVAVRSFPRRYRTALAAGLDDGDDTLLRRRPQPDVWSALEYTAHVADVLAGSAGWVREMRLHDRPDLAMPTGGAFAEVEGGGSSPDRVLDTLAAGAASLATQLDEVGADDWHRAASFPFGERDILATLRRAVHEGSHHLRDVESVLDEVRGAA